MLRLRGQSLSRKQWTTIYLQRGVGGSEGIAPTRSAEYRDQSGQMSKQVECVDWDQRDST
jgi:hypothetical protein